MLLETIILPAVLPAAVDALKTLFGGISRKIGGLSPDDQVKLQTSEIEKLKALATLDTPAGTPSQWVIDLRASFRYIGAGISILGGLGVIYVGMQNGLPSAVDTGQALVAAPYSFIFGERLYFGMTGRTK